VWLLVGTDPSGYSFPIVEQLVQGGCGKALEGPV
jgi:hypothetical protein